MIEYGTEPQNLGLMDLDTTEMMHWLYLPIWMPGSDDIRLPDNLKHLQPLANRCFSDAAWNSDIDTDQSYGYLTAKTLWVTPQNLGNRPGWHADGFGTEDLNYIWYDKFPTEFSIQKFQDIGTDEQKSMNNMMLQVKRESIKTYPCRNLLKLTPAVVHRVPIIKHSGVPTFIKLSVSRDRYDMEGNSHNHLFDYDWPMQKRGAERNTTTASPPEHGA